MLTTRNYSFSNSLHFPWCNVLSEISRSFSYWFPRSRTKLLILKVFKLLNLRFLFCSLFLYESLNFSYQHFMPRKYSGWTETCVACSVTWWGNRIWGSFDWCLTDFAGVNFKIITVIIPIFFLPSETLELSWEGFKFGSQVYPKNRYRCRLMVTVVNFLMPKNRKCKERNKQKKREI